VGSTANNYQILARLAVGGMAEIFLARGVGAAGVERYCVLKRILRERASDLHFVRMFLDEARLAAQLNHPNVAQVYDIGMLSDSYFFTMEYVHGETVRAVLQRARSLRREMPLGSVLTIVAGTAAGLHHAHDRLGFDGRPLGIVHRDVSPSNLMISFEGGVKVVDFGVAKAADRMQETRSGTVKGKISYLSPEQCRGTEVDRRTDLFALGIVMWEMVTGERLYRRASDFENMNAIVNEPTPPPSARRRGVPPEIDDIVMRLLAKDPAARYQTADDLIAAIEQAAPVTGAMISSSSLGRLLREMFGQRPEPWLEMDPLDAPEGVTVTSEPIPSELVPIPDSMDLHLAGIPDLSGHSMASQDAVPLPVAATASARQRMTAQMRPTRSSDASAPMEAPPLPPPPPRRTDDSLAPQPGELPLPAPPATLPEVLPNRSYPVSMSGAPALRPSGVDPAGRRSGPVQPLATPGSGRHAVPPSGPHGQPSSGGYVLPVSGAHAAASGAHAAASVPMVDADPAQEEKSSRGWPMLAVILVAMVIGSLTVLLVMKTGGSSPSFPDAPAAHAPEIAAAPPAPPAVPPAPAATLDAEAAEPPPASPPEASLDAAVAPPELDAPPEPTKTPLERAMDDQRYDDAVMLCNRRFNPDVALLCTLAACHEKLEPKARTWFPRVPPAERQRLIGTCRSLGVDPVVHRPAPPQPSKSDAGVEDKCEKNPMSCQH